MVSGNIINSRTKFGDLRMAEELRLPRFEEYYDFDPEADADEEPLIIDVGRYLEELRLVV